MTIQPVVHVPASDNSKAFWVNCGFFDRSQLKLILGMFALDPEARCTGNSAVEQQIARAAMEFYYN